MSTDAIRQDITEAMKLKLIGNEQLRTSNAQQARDTYIEALKVVLSAVSKLKQTIQDNEAVLREQLQVAHELDGLKAEIEEIRIQLISNLSLTEIKLELWEEAQAHAAMVVVADPSNIKALFRRAVARIRLRQQLDETLVDLQRLSERDPANPDIAAEITRCRIAIQDERNVADAFKSNIRGTLNPNKEKRSKRSSTGIIESLMSTWISTVGPILAQCGGLRPQRGVRIKRTD